MKKIPTKTKQVLSPFQLRVLEAFYSRPGVEKFFLTGGTALAGFYLFHRRSVDLDFFTTQGFDRREVTSLVGKLAKNLGATIREAGATTDTFSSVVLIAGREELKIDFVADLPVEFGKREKFGNVIVDSLENIAVNKITAVFGRTDPKDFVDLYFLLTTEKFDFEDLVSKAKKKDIGITEFYLAGALDNIQNITTLPEMLVPLNHKQLEKYFLKLSKDLFLQIKPAK